MSIFRSRLTDTDAIFCALVPRRNRMFSEEAAREILDQFNADREARRRRYRANLAKRRWPIATEDEVEEIAAVVTKSLTQHKSELLSDYLKR